MKTPLTTYLFMRSWPWMNWPLWSPCRLRAEWQKKHNFMTQGAPNLRLLIHQQQHVCYLLPVFLLLQAEYSSSGEEESLLSSSISSGRSVSSFCSYGKKSTWKWVTKVAPQPSDKVHGVKKKNRIHKQSLTAWEKNASGDTFVESWK